MKIEWVKRVYGDGFHNAFTGLARFEERYYLAFRSAEAHLTSSAKQIIMTSTDGENWKIEQENDFQNNPEMPVDYRDSYFLATDDELKLYSFCTPSIDGVRQQAYSQVQLLSKGAEKWSGPMVVKDDAVLWKPRYCRDGYFAVGYYYDNGHKCDLFHSKDGTKWQYAAHIGNGSEADLLQKENGNLLVFCRTEKPPYSLEIIESEPPFTKWKLVNRTSEIIQCPHLFQNAGKTCLLGRYRPDYMKTAQKDKPSFARHRTKIWEYKNENLVEVLELPGAGDNAYPGTTLCPDGSLLVSYYSQRETPEGYIWGERMCSDIYVAKIKLC